MSSKKLWIVGLMAMALGVGALASAVAADDAAMPSGFKGDMIYQIKEAESKLVDLADATPEAKYAYRPGKGVRSTGEVFLHVAAANFGIPSMMGVTPPEGFKLDGYEKSMTKKADIQKALKDSFAHVENAIANTSDADMDKQVTVFGQQMTERAAYMIIVSHVHEHLGQSIAYARVNGIVPPWTAKQQAAMKEDAEKKKTDAK
jgi:uncharacterized damage-inducible protein DinB